MIKRTSRNFKVPLTYGGQWKDHQTFQKWDPIGKRIVTVMCDCNPKIVPAPAPAPPPPPPTNFYFTRVSTGGDPGTGNFSIEIISPQSILGLSVSITTNTGGDATTWLSTGVANATYIKVQKDLSNYVVLQRSMSVSGGTFWFFYCTIFMTAGIVNNGDSVEISYT